MRERESHRPGEPLRWFAKVRARIARARAVDKQVHKRSSRCRARRLVLIVRCRRLPASEQRPGAGTSPRSCPSCAPALTMPASYAASRSTSPPRRARGDRHRSTTSSRCTPAATSSRRSTSSDSFTTDATRAEATGREAGLGLCLPFPRSSSSPRRRRASASTLARLAPIVVVARSSIRRCSMTTSPASF